MKTQSSSDPDSYISTRMKGIEMSGIRKMFDLASRDAIHLGLGEPDFEPPEVAVNALMEAVRSGVENRRSSWPTEWLSSARGTCVTSSFG